jgi:hypothetical protein
VAIALVLIPALSPGSAAAQSADDRYSVVHGCFALKSEQTGLYAVKAGLGYTVTGATAGAGEPFRMQATDLGRYLFYGPAQDFMAITVPPPVGTVGPAAEPSDNSDWTVVEDGGSFRVVNEFVDRDLVVAGGALATVPQGTGGPAGLFDFDATTGCADYPEVEVNVSGPVPPATGNPSAPVKGLVETHMHQMAFQFLGTETALSQDPCHTTDGWPTFNGWPKYQHYTHEQSYYKWLERSWRGGLRIFVNLMVENRVLCELYPLTPQPASQNCNEMDSVRRQVQSIHELERYIDAQSGGPGKGWYRIVESPAEARRVINEGKLAVIKGMEVSEPFGCRLMQPGDMSLCSEQQVDDGVDEIYEDLGIRQVEIVNKFDNALTGVAGDSGEAGVITNLGNFSSAGTFWDYEHCDGENHDHSPATPTHNDDALIAGGLDLFGDTTGVSPPTYGPPPHCNQRGFSTLGRQALQRMMGYGMIFDPDHQSVIARNQALDLVEQYQYPGVITSHSWSTPNAWARISGLGGFIGPAAKSPQSFVAQWQDINAHSGGDAANPYLFGLGYGADMNGFAQQGGPPSQPITYPFESPVQPGVMIDQQQSGTKLYDYNMTGTAHYGLYPDWAEAVRIIGGPQIMNDMVNGAEAYLQMWERAVALGKGIPVANADPCAPLRAKLKRAKSKKQRGKVRKLRKKLRKQGCIKKKKKRKKKRKKRSR